MLPSTASICCGLSLDLSVVAIWMQVVQIWRESCDRDHAECKMALFSRIFQNRRNCRSNSQSSENKKRCGVPEFERSQIRLVLFKDHDLKGRSLLFDSTAVHRVDGQGNAQNTKTSKFYVPLGKSPKPPDGGGGRDEDEREAQGGSTGPNSHPGFTFSKPGSDTKMLGEMMYGSVAMSYKGSTFKVHSIRSPPQVMMTKVFRLNNGSKETTQEGESFDGYSIQSIPGDSATPRRINNPASPQIAHSVPMDVPSPPKRDFPDLETEDSGFSNSLTSSTSSLCTSLPSPGSSASNSFTNSMNSMHRRLMRSQTTSLEYNLMKRASDESMVAPSPVPASKRPLNIGAGIIFILPADEGLSKELQYFLFSHIMLLESHINKLCRSIEKACATKKLFLRNVFEAFEVFIESIRDLYLTPRLSQPVWLSMTTGNTMHRIPMCQRFLKELMVCLDKYDTKSTKFFVSTLVTAVLTHHLAWVPTVTPAWATPSRTYLDKHSAKWLDAIAKSHPYNPLWAQLSDLYGAIGFPTRLSRTVVVGRKSDLVNRMLYILSYFIRCSEVLENTDQQPVLVETEYLNEESPDYSDDKHAYKDTDRFVENDGVFLDTGLPFASYLDSRTVSTSDVSNKTTSKPLSHSGSPNKSQFMFDGHVDSGLPDLDSGLHEPNSNDCGDCGRNGALELSSSVLPPDAAICDIPSSLNTEQLSQHQVPCHPPVICDNVKQSMHSVNLSLTSNVSVGCDHEDLSLGSLSDFSLLQHDLRRIQLESRENCMESSADSSCTLTQSSDEKQLAKSLSKKSPIPTEIDIPQEENEVDSPCQLSPVPPVNHNRRELARNVGRVNPAANAYEVNQFGTNLSPVKSRSPESKCDSQKGPTILLEGNSLNADLQSSELRPRKGSTQSETSSSRSREDLDSGIFESACRCPVGCSISRDSSADNLCNIEGSRDAASTPNSDVNESPKQKSPSVHLANQSRIVMERSNSMFDEYFAEESIPDTSTVNATTSKVDSYKRMASIEGSSSIFDEYLNEPCPDVSNITVTRSRSSSAVRDSVRKTDSSNLNMFDEYFDGEEESSLPRVEFREQVEDALNLMQKQQKQKGKEEEPASPTKHKRPSSLKLDLSRTPSARSSGAEFSRQNSTMSNVSLGLSTPTPGVRRKRHQSSVSTTSVETVDFFRHLKELPMPKSEDASEEGFNIQNFDRNFGRSLLAGYSDRYLSDFVLHGTKDINFQARLHTDLTMAVQEPVLDEPIAEAACVIADTDKWSVRLQTCQCSSSDRVLSKEMTASRFILDMMESVHDLWKLKMSPEFCLMHLEDKLQEIYFKSKVLAEYIRSHQKVSLKELANVLNFDVSDLPLMLAVAGTHSSLLTLALMS